MLGLVQVDRLIFIVANKLFAKGIPSGETVKLLSWLLSNPRLKSWVNETKKYFINRFNGLSKRSDNPSSLILFTNHILNKFCLILLYELYMG